MTDAETTSSSRPPLLPSLTGLRFPAALCILLGHIAGWITPIKTLPDVYRAFEIIIYLGMSSFFVLSGFVLAYNHADAFRRPSRSAVAAFYRARIIRIYPVYLFFLLTSVFHDNLIQKSAENAGYVYAFFANLFCVESWFYADVYGVNLNTGFFGLSWAISVEFFFYLAFPFLCATFHNCKNRIGAWTLFFGIILAAYAVMYGLSKQVNALLTWYFQAFGVARTVDETVRFSFYQWAIYLFPGTRIFEFALGMSGAWILKDLRAGDSPMAAFLRREAAIALCLAALAGLCGLAYLGQGSMFILVLQSNILFAPVLVLLMLALSLRNMHGERPLASHTLTTLGASTYCLYLAQTFTVNIFATSYPAPFSPAAVADWTARALFACLFSVLAGLGFHHYLETPLFRVFSGQSRRVA
jgi:peptidoglycan/LPS O-acetylase OafA/YrhL